MNSLFYGFFTILALSALSLIIIKFYQLYHQSKPTTKAWGRTVFNFLAKQEAKEAIHFCQASSRLLSPASITSIQLAQVNTPFSTISDELNKPLLEQIPHWERSLTSLSLIGNFAVLTGLLGTIIKMIQAFGAVATLPTSQKSPVLILSIQEAMTYTAFGMAIALPCFIAYAILQNRANILSQDLADGALEIVKGLCKFNPKTYG